jgi:glycosyltransferase involved in cell wall biosynthesis
MRITFVAPRYPPAMGGVELHVKMIAESAVRAGHDVTVLCHRDDLRVTPHTEVINGVTMRRFQTVVTNPNFTFAPQLGVYLRRHGPELGVVHSHAYHALPALEAALAKRYPLVFTPHYHGTGHSWFRKLLHPPYRRVGRLTFERADKVICVSAAEALLVAKYHPNVMPRTTIIHNGVDIEAIRSAAPLPEPGTVILSAGRLETYKRVDQMVAAMAHLPADHTLVVCGDGPARADLEAQAAGLGLGERVRLLGRVSDEDLHRWFRTAAVYVNLSSNEAYPITPNEALVAGARVLASEIPAHHEVLASTGGTMALVTVPCPPPELAARLQELLAAPYREAAVESWDEVTEKTIEIYREVSARRR